MPPPPSRSANGQHHHRSSSLKQSNKSYKSRYATKSSLRAASKGKVQHTTVQGTATAAISKADRRNVAKMAIKHKRENLLATKRLFTGPGALKKTVLLLPMSTDVNLDQLLLHAHSCANIESSILNGHNLFLPLAKFKQTLHFLQCTRQYLDIIDAAKIADFIVPVFSANQEADEFSQSCLRTIQAQGVPRVLSVVQYINGIHIKKRNDVKKSLLSFISYFFPDQKKIFEVDTPDEVALLLSSIANLLPRQVLWKDDRAFLIVENMSFENSDENAKTGVLAITGQTRGGALFSANRLVHIPDYGDFQVIKIVAAVNPLVNLHATSNEMIADNENTVLSLSNPEIMDPLISENEIDSMNNEQTWPTEEEMKGHESLINEKKARKVKRVPKGTSAYQAAWILDSDNDSDDSERDGDDDDGDDDMVQDEHLDDDDDGVSRKEEQVEGEEEEEYEDLVLDDHEKKMVEEYNVEEEEQQLAEFLAKRKAEEEEDREFPDEIDTPRNVPARIRFQKYRGLESFRTSPWDPYENLPLDYGRIFQFENYKRTKNRVLSQSQSEGVPVGAYVTIYLADVPCNFTEANFSSPLTVFGLHQHEHKISIAHFTLTMEDNEELEAIRSKETLILQYGFRRFKIHPLFSEHTRGGGKGVNNVHRFLRYLRPGSTNVASVYAPITFGTQVPALFFRESESRGLDLVGTGLFFNIDPQRITAKRIILTGHPYKVHKRSAVIRYMFFNPEDVQWFQPVQIGTKYGRVGHIFESIGTHGYMKCRFDKPIKQHDTICMKLYKRVFPKWNTELWRKVKPQEQTEEATMEIMA